VQAGRFVNLLYRKLPCRKRTLLTRHSTTKDKVRRRQCANWPSRERSPGYCSPLHAKHPPSAPALAANAELRSRRPTVHLWPSATVVADTLPLQQRSTRSLCLPRLWRPAARPPSTRERQTGPVRGGSVRARGGVAAHRAVSHGGTPRSERAAVVCRQPREARTGAAARALRRLSSRAAVASRPRARAAAVGGSRGPRASVVTETRCLARAHGAAPLSAPHRYRRPVSLRPPSTLLLLRTGPCFLLLGGAPPRSPRRLPAMATPIPTIDATPTPVPGGNVTVSATLNNKNQTGLIISLVIGFAVLGLSLVLFDLLRRVLPAVYYWRNVYTGYTEVARDDDGRPLPSEPVPPGWPLSPIWKAMRMSSSDIQEVRCESRGGSVWGGVRRHRPFGAGSETGERHGAASSYQLGSAGGKPAVWGASVRWRADIRRLAEHVCWSAAVCCAAVAVGPAWWGAGVGRAGVPGLCGVTECLRCAVGTLCARLRGCHPCSARCDGVCPAQTGLPSSAVAFVVGRAVMRTSFGSRLTLVLVMGCGSCRSLVRRLHCALLLRPLPALIVLLPPRCCPPCSPAEVRP